MNNSAASIQSSCAFAISLLVAAADVPRFAPALRFHDQALFELSELANSGELSVNVDAWKFIPSANGGYALVGLMDVFLVLSEEGWLGRDRAAIAYVVSSELRQRGAQALARLSPEERRRVADVAYRWKARATVSSKNAA
jgi:hypothetical protein